MDFRSLLQSMNTLSEAEGKVHKGTYGTSHGKEDVRDQYGHKVGKVDKEAGTKKDAPKKGRGRPKKGADDSGEVKTYDTKSLGDVFGGGKKPKKEIGKVSKKHSLKEYMEAAEQAIQEGQMAPVEIKPASQTNTQVIQQGNKTLGTVNNPQLAAQIKQSIGKGEMTLNPDEEMAEGKDEGKPGKNFAKIAKSAGEKYGSKAAGERVAGAVRAKLAKQGKLEESRVYEGSEYTHEEVAKVLSREKPGLDTTSDEFHSAVYHELIQQGLTPKAARYKLNVDEDFMSDVASAYSHYQANPSLDEGSFDDLRQNALKEPTSSFTKPGSPMAVPKGTPTKLNRPVPDETPWSVDPINAATDRAINFISGLRKPKSPFSEGTDMKDIQLESWEKQLNTLLSEGITVSSSTGQQGSPDSVTISATDADAGQLLGVLRNAGIGVFGSDEKPEIGYGVAQGGEEEPTGTGTEPEASPDVVGDGDDMMALIKKMAGIGGDAPTAGGDEEGQDYEDEEGAEDTALQPADAGEDDGQEELTGSADSDKEETDEGNKFTGNLAKARAAGKSEADLDGDGDMEKVHEGEDTCNECGMYESECGCEHESVEESFANDAGGDAMAEAELAKLKALLSMGNDLHRQKSSQAMGNPVRVAESNTINDWKKLSGIK